MPLSKPMQPGQSLKATDSRMRPCGDVNSRHHSDKSPREDGMATRVNGNPFAGPPNKKRAASGRTRSTFDAHARTWLARSLGFRIVRAVLT